MSKRVHESYIRQAIDLATLAKRNGDHPFGAVIVASDRAVYTATNSVISDTDCTRHAEMNAISICLRSKVDLAGATLYASTEPCAMCAGAIFWAGVSCVVYGCSADRLGSYTTGSLIVPCADILGRGKRPVKIIGPLLEGIAAQVHKGFWKANPKTSVPAGNRGQYD